VRVSSSIDLAWPSNKLARFIMSGGKLPRVVGCCAFDGMIVSTVTRPKNAKNVLASKEYHHQKLLPILCAPQKSILVRPWIVPNMLDVKPKYPLTRCQSAMIDIELETAVNYFICAAKSRNCSTHFTA